jgi:hypothetical protein
LNQTLFWTAADLEVKLQAFQRYFNRDHRTHSGLEGRLPEQSEPQAVGSHKWQKYCRGLYQTPLGRVISGIRHQPGFPSNDAMDEHNLVNAD